MLPDHSFLFCLRLTTVAAEYERYKGSVCVLKYQSTKTMYKGAAHTLLSSWGLGV